MFDILSTAFVGPYIECTKKHGMSSKTNRNFLYSGLSVTCLLRKEIKKWSRVRLEHVTLVR